MNKRVVTWAVENFENLPSWQSTGFISNDWRVSLRLLDENDRVTAIKSVWLRAESMEEDAHTNKIELDCLHFHSWGLFLSQQTKQDDAGW